MATFAEVVVALKLDDTDFRSGIAKASGEINRFGGAMHGVASLGGSVLGVGLAAAAGGAVALGVGLGASTKAAMEAQRVQAQLEAVLRSTGGVAGVTTEQVNSYADAMSRVTMFDDEAIVSAQSLMLTFTNIGKEVFPAATTTALDMAQAMGIDLQSAVVMLGKALQDPVLGVSALRRVGVNFNDTQTEMIKNLVESGNLLDAQNMILRELQTEFGGSAEAAGKTFAGQLAILRTQLGNVMEQVGAGLLPVLSQLASTLADELNRPEVKKFITDLATGIANLAGVIVAQLPNVVTWIKNAFGWFSENQSVVIGALAAIGFAIAAFVYTTVIPAAIATITSLAPIIGVILLIAGIVALVHKAWTENWGGIQEKVAAAREFIANVLQSLSVVINSALAYYRTIFEAFQAAFSGDWYTFGAKLREAWDMAWKAIGTVASTAWNNLKSAVQQLITNIMQFFKNTNWGEVGMAIVRGIANGITSAVDWAIKAIINLASAVIEAIRGFLGIQSPSRLFRDEIGRNMALGVVHGWQDVLTADALNVPLARLNVSAGIQPSGVASSISFYAPVTFKVENATDFEELFRRLR